MPKRRTHKRKSIIIARFHARMLDKRLSRGCLAAAMQRKHIDYYRFKILLGFGAEFRRWE